MPSEAAYSAEADGFGCEGWIGEGGLPMHYVYLLQSESFVDQRYVGMASDLKRRLSDHNSRKSPHTSKFVPWKLVTYVAFSDEQKARTFERYLKSGSGHAFARKRLW
jgi:putative endonuclease